MFCKILKSPCSYEKVHWLVKLQVHSFVCFFHILQTVLCPMPQNSLTCTIGYVKINFPDPAKLLLQETFLKIKMRKFLQKRPTPEKIVNFTPDTYLPMTCWTYYIMNTRQTSENILTHTGQYRKYFSIKNTSYSSNLS